MMKSSGQLFLKFFTFFHIAQLFSEKLCSSAHKLRLRGTLLNVMLCLEVNEMIKMHVLNGINYGINAGSTKVVVLTTVLIIGMVYSLRVVSQNYSIVTNFNAVGVNKLFTLRYICRNELARSC